MSNRKGLIKTSTIAAPKKSLNINIEINNEDLWFISVTTKFNTFKMPCRLDSMMRRFDNQKDNWDVVVLGKWINSDGRQFVKLD